jgi:hypothetical protein
MKSVCSFSALFHNLAAPLEPVAICDRLLAKLEVTNCDFKITTHYGLLPFLRIHSAQWSLKNLVRLEDIWIKYFLEVEHPAFPKAKLGRRAIRSIPVWSTRAHSNPWRESRYSTMDSPKSPVIFECRELFASFIMIYFFLCTFAAIPQSGTRFAPVYFFFCILAATFSRNAFSRMKPVASSWL